MYVCIVAVPILGVGAAAMAAGEAVLGGLGVAALAELVYSKTKKTPEEIEEEEEKKKKEEEEKEKAKPPPPTIEQSYTERGKGSGPDGGDFDTRMPRYYKKGDKRNNGEFVQRDRAANSGSGPHTGGWKLFDSSGRRIGTVSNSKDGIVRVNK
jgi:hypothetical protein